MSLGYDEVAKICLTHSFNNQTTKEYIGKFDVSGEELNLIKNTLVQSFFEPIIAPNNFKMIGKYRRG